MRQYFQLAPNRRVNRFTLQKKNLRLVRFDELIGREKTKGTATKCQAEDGPTLTQYDRESNILTEGIDGPG